MSDINSLRLQLNYLTIKKNNVLEKIDTINNQILHMGMEYIKSNHLNLTTPIEYLPLYSTDVIELYIKDLYGPNVIWGQTPTTNLINNPYVIFNIITPILSPILIYMSGIQYLSPELYKHKLITYLINVGVQNTNVPTIYCKYCKECDHEIENCHNMICSYCNQQGHTIKNCNVVPCNYCNQKGHRKFRFCLKTGNKIITCPYYREVY